jgi:hypothetical protein
VGPFRFRGDVVGSQRRDLEIWSFFFF